MPNSEIKSEPPSDSSVPKRLLTVKEAAVYLGRSPWSIRELYYSGELKCVRVGRRIHFDIKDLDEWIDQHKEDGSV